jgi:hypothetical protein
MGQTTLIIAKQNENYGESANPADASQTTNSSFKTIVKGALCLLVRRKED